MALETGTATGYIDLLNKLITFLSTNVDLVADSQNWTIHRNRTNPDNEKEMVVEGPGLNGNNKIYVGIKTVSGIESGLEYYNFILQGFSGFDDAFDFDGQPKAIATGFPPILHLWDQTIPYKFVANGRAFIIYAQVSTVYQMSYQGLGLVGNGTPSQTPNPDDFKNALIIGGCSTDQTARFSKQGEAYSMFWNPAKQSGVNYGSLYLNFNGGWKNFDNTGADNKTFPYRQDMWSVTRENIDNSLPMRRIELRTLKSPANNGEGNFVGYLEHLVAVSGSSLSSESTIEVTDTGDLDGDWEIIQNVFRTEPDQFCALHLT